jgi:Flp pilus assembly protein TadG
VTGRRRPGRRRAHGRDRGSFTAELAAGLPALMMLLLVGLTAVGAVSAKAQCVDAAREGALTAARGGPGTDAAARIAPDGAAIDVAEGEATVKLSVRAPVPILGGSLPAITVRATAVAAREPTGTVTP